MPSNHLILYRLLLLPPSIFLSIRVFSNESALCIRWTKYWSFSFSIDPYVLQIMSSHRQFQFQSNAGELAAAFPFSTFVTFSDVHKPGSRDPQHLSCVIAPPPDPDAAPTRAPAPQAGPWWSSRPLPAMSPHHWIPSTSEGRAGNKREGSLTTLESIGVQFYSLPSMRVHVFVLKFLRETQNVSIRWKRMMYIQQQKCSNRMLVSSIPVTCRVHPPRGRVPTLAEGLRCVPCELGSSPATQLRSERPL